MARSSYIYVVRDAIDGELITAFTVKHELARWLDARSSKFLITRIHDGGQVHGRPPVTLDPRTLEPVT